MEFLELLESIRAEEASTARLYAGDGTNIRSVQGRNNPRYLQSLAEAAQLIADVQAGRKPVWRLQEAMTTSDFPLLFGDILDRQLLGNYRESPYTWNQIARSRTVPDFRQVSRHFVDGAEGVLEQVPEQTEYPMAALSEGRYQYSVAKFGRRLPFSWEAMINDDLDALTDSPARLGKAARRSEEKFITGLFVGPNGPHASLYTTNVVSGNPALTHESLRAALIQFTTQTDADGEPIVFDAVNLVVPPALRFVAADVVNTVRREIVEDDVTLIVNGNGLMANLNIVVNYYIPHVATSSNGDTSWFLFGSPNDGRPALEVGFLRGHAEPEIWMKSPNAIRVGGGSVNAMDGDFDTDSIHYRIRHVFGGGRLDPKSTLASSGAGA